MKLFNKIGREFSGYNILESGKRLFDRKPLQCSLLCLVLAIAGRPEWVLRLWIAITAMILSLAGVARRKANRERVVAPIRSTGKRLAYQPCVKILRWRKKFRACPTLFSCALRPVSGADSRNSKV